MLNNALPIIGRVLFSSNRNDIKEVKMCLSILKT